MSSINYRDGKLRSQQDLQKLFAFAFRRWLRARQRFNYCDIRRDRFLDKGRYLHAADRWFAAVEKLQRMYRQDVAIRRTAH